MEGLLQLFDRGFPFAFGGEQSAEIEARREVLRISCDALPQERFLNDEPLTGAASRQQLQPDVAHFVGGPIAGHDPLLGCIVVSPAHRNDRVLRQKHGLPIPKHCLPVQVPLRDANQLETRSAGQFGNGFDLFAEVVRMRIDRKQVGVGWQLEIVADRKVTRAGRNVERGIVFELHQQRMKLRRPPQFHPLLVQLEHDAALDIPPGARNFTVGDDFKLPADADLLAIYPHAHYLGKQVEAVAELPGGSRLQLIRISKWDLNWQAVYRYRKPVFLPKNTVISMRWTYDNTTDKRVVAGDRASDEMGHVWLQLLPRGGAGQRLVIEEALLRQRVARDPEDFTARFNLGGLLAAKGERKAAIEELQQALHIRSNDEVALNTLGALVSLEGKPDEAEALFRRAIEARPDYADAHYNLANVLLARDAVDEAIEHLRSVKADEKARVRLAEALNARAHGRAENHDLVGAAE